jgi:uncharacterized tellurite resistance protein B-like protein
MADRTLIIALAQVLAAAAWADGDLNPEEVDRLKQLLRQLPQRSKQREVEIEEQDWAQVEIYLHAPVSAAERTRLIEQLRVALHSPADRQLAVATLEDLIRADGVVTDSERAVLVEIRSALDAVNLGIFSRLGRLLRGRGEPAVSNRTDDLDDFLQNRVFYLLRRQHGADPATLGIPEQELRRLSVAGALLALMARVDHAVGPDEVAALSTALQRGWGLAPAPANLVAQIAVLPEATDVEFVRLTNAFLNYTDEAERIRFLDALFAVAAADGQISPAELDEIRRIAHSLKLETHNVNDARDRAVRQSA